MNNYKSNYLELQDLSAGDLAYNHLTIYTQLYDEIVSGYEDGTRELWVVDNESESGYRKLTMDEELQQLDKAADNFAELIDYLVNIQPMKTAATIKAAKDAQESLARHGILRDYVSGCKEPRKPEPGTEDIFQNIMTAVQDIKDGYQDHRDNLFLFSHNVFQKNVHLKLSEKGD